MIETFAALAEAQDRAVAAVTARSGRPLTEREIWDIKWPIEHDAVQRLYEAGNVKARVTFLGALTDDQREMHDTRNRVRVKGSRGTLYELGCDRAVSNVTWLRPDGGIHGRCCVAPRNRDPFAVQSGRLWKGFPLYDLLLGQMLGLMADEDQVMAVAVLNSGGWPPGCPRADNHNPW
jgi:hypothetical protein